MRNLPQAESEQILFFIDLFSYIKENYTTERIVKMLKVLNGSRYAGKSITRFSYESKQIGGSDMKKLLITCAVVLLLFSFSIAGGIVTNTNQSAKYVRTLNRNASTEIDAVYFNPAGLVKLEDGLHLSVSNQSVFQTWTVKNDYLNLNENEFIGKVQAPLFPNIYLAYKKDKWALSAGFEPIGGGGSANFEKGLPSFEMPVSNLKSQLGIADYSLDCEFEGSSIYYGTQAGITYRINDMIAVAVGARYVMAQNDYVGHLKNIKVPYGAEWVTPAEYLTGVASTLESTASGLQPIIDGGAGDMTLAQLQNAGQLTAGEVDELEEGLNQIGVDPTDLTAAQIQSAYNSAADNMFSQVPKIEAATADMEVDASQTGAGFSPIFSLFISPLDGLGIGLRYEMKTSIELENDTKVDGSGTFPDSAKTHGDMPAMFALGVSYQAMDKLRTEFGFNYYFNKDVNWNGREENVDNGHEIGIMLEYEFSDKLKGSIGFLNADGGAKPAYQTDQSFSLKSNTIGIGIGYSISPQLELNIGGLNTFYQEDEKETDDYTEKYMKTTVDFGIGINYKF